MAKQKGNTAPTPEATEAEGKTVVRPDVTKYQAARSASGAKSLHNGDPVAVALEGATVDEIYALASEGIQVPEDELRAKYSKLNDGMQRMNLGNRLRGIVNKLNKEKDGSGEKWIKSLASGLRQTVDARVKEAAKAKAAAEKERAAKAAEKAKAEKKAAKAA